MVTLFLVGVLVKFISFYVDRCIALVTLGAQKRVEF